MNATRPKRQNLGRGLSALLGEDEAVSTPSGIIDGDLNAADERAGRAVTTLPVEYLRPGRYQPRHAFDESAIDDLVDSVRDKGILQPILVRRHPDENDSYEIIAGERRWRAAQRAQLHEVPVIVRDFNDREALEVALVENLQRQDLNALEEAEGYQRLMAEFSHTQEALAKAVGKSRSHVANMMRLLNLPDAVKAYVQDGKLTAGHARALLGAENPLAVAEAVIHKGLNVRQTEKIAKTGLVKSNAGRPKGSKASRGAAIDKDADTLALERDLSTMLGLEVTITFQGSGGELTIAYDTLEQLDGILGRLTRSAA